MKKLSALLALLIYGGTAMAQAPDYNDLRILYADANYDKLIRESEKYTLKDDTKSDPTPYVWLAKGLFRIQGASTGEEKYKNAFKDALTALGSAKKKDKDGSVFAAEAEFVDTVKATLAQTIMDHITAKEFQKANSWIIKVYKISPDDVGAKFLEGACKFRAGDKGGANILWKDAEKRLTAVNSINDWSRPDKEMLKIGVLETAECYVSSKQVDKAKTILNKIAQWYENDEEFKKRYDEIVN
jgi:hypothetical protein